MSATGRGSERNEDDFYATPAWCVHRLLEKWTPPPGMWLEPGAGTGAIIRAASTMFNPAYIQWAAVEKRNGAPKDLYVDWLRDDFLGDRALEWAKQLADDGIRITIGNPPYLLAQQFADRCFELSEQTALLLRLNFLGSEERAEWWEKHPADVYVLPNRPSFCTKLKCKSCGWKATRPANFTPKAGCEGCGNKLTITRTDACEYAWFVWSDASIGRGYSELYHLALTSEAERYQRAA